MIKVAKLSEIPQCGSKLVMVGETPVALLNIKGKIHAWDTRCPHRGASLADGNITEDVIQCKFHLWKFDVNKACAVANPDIKIKSYAVEMRGDGIYLGSTL